MIVHLCRIFSVFCFVVISGCSVSVSLTDPVGEKPPYLMSREELFDAAPPGPISISKKDWRRCKQVPEYSQWLTRYRWVITRLCSDGIATDQVLATEGFPYGDDSLVCERIGGYRVQPRCLNYPMWECWQPSQRKKYYRW